QIAQLGIGLVPEGRQIFPNLSVFENLISTHSNRTGLGHWDLDRILDIFPELAGRLNAMGSVLSGGEQQMLAIGRALMTNPGLLILDEATEGLAPLIRKKIWQCLQTIRTMGLSILIVDKNLADLLKIADRHYIVQKGKVTWSGTSEELGSNPALQKKYLGV
ncbi:MAG: ABC transporter ATP-binding protein, partial [Desulfobulbia bacterium]